LAYDGFYAFDGQTVVPITEGIEDEVKRFVKSRIVQSAAAIDPTTSEYICWVPVNDSNINNRGYVFDGVGWKIRTGARYTGLCTTSDHRQYVLGCGIVPGEHPADTREGDYGVMPPNNGVWVLDHESRSFYPTASSRQPIFETSWLGAGESQRKTALTVKVWFRETSTTEQVRVRIYRDWRKDEQVHSLTLDLDSPEDPPPAWGTTTTADEEKWHKRRPYWIRKDLYIPSCEVFKLRFEGIVQEESSIEIHPQDGTESTVVRELPADLEIIALIVDESPRPGGGRVPRSS
jgi:hypothetical protein